MLPIPVWVTAREAGSMTWFAVLALVWLIVAALALQAHQRGSTRSTRRWTTRLYAVTLVPLTALAVGGALVAVQLAFAEARTEDAINAATPYAQWLAIAVNLVVVDVVLRRRDVGEHRPRQTATRTSVVSTDSPIQGHIGAPLPRSVSGR